MKKKIMAILLIATMALSLSGCSSNSSDSSKDIETTGENIRKEEYVTKEYCGLTFEIPANVEYNDDDSAASITFEPKKKAVSIVPTDMSELGDLAEVYEALAISSTLEAYDNIQNQEDYTTTIAGVSADATTATVQISDSWFSLSVVSFTNEDLQYRYTISYLVDESADEDHSDYEAFVESITFN